MIPFDVDSSVYIPSIICVIGVIILTIPTLCKDTRNVGLIGVAIFSILGMGSFVGFVMSGSIYTDNITICAHTEGNYMKVIDTNQNLYYVSDDLTQMKVKDSTTVKVKIENKMGTKYIYHIDAPIRCNNSTCGVAT